MEKFLITVAGIVIGTVLAVLLLLPFILIGTVVNAFAIELYWSWFVIPVFKTLPVLTLGQSFGLAMFVSLFFLGVSRFDKKASDLEENKEYYKLYVHGVAKYITMYSVIFVVGYIAHLILT